MKVRLFDGPDLTTVIRAVRDSLGSDALIIETKQVAHGVAILAAVEAEKAELPPLEVPVIADAYLDERRGRLVWHGISEELVARLTERDLAHALTRRIGFGSIELSGSAAPLLFAGEPGAGKTVSLVKIATRLVMAGTKPLIVTVDSQKAGAAEQLAAMTRILGLTLLVADRPQTLQRALAMREGSAPALIDGPGLGVRDSEENQLLRSLVAAVQAELVLVVPAGLDAAETVDVALYHAAMGARRMIATRLDVARRIGGIVEAAWRSRLVLTEAGTGSSVVDGLQPLTAHVLASRLDDRVAADGVTTDQRWRAAGGRHGR